MNDYLLLMHDDAPAPDPAHDAHDAWGPYLEALRASGCFAGGSSIGPGVCVNKAGTSVPIAAHLTGFLRVRAKDLDHARSFLAGNPVFEAGGTIEIRELPQD